MNTLIALSPIILIIALLLFKKPLSFSAPLTFLYTLVLMVFVWKQDFPYTIASMDKAGFVAIDIGLIVFGAIFFLEVLKRTGIMKNIQAHLQSVTQDVRLQAIILIWFFGAFLEGTAGFGTPAAIVAPLLVGLGFTPVTAVILALIGNSSPVAFGAIGTPIRIGLAGLDITGVPVLTAILSGIASLIVPLIILFAIVKLEKKDKSYFFGAVPFAIWAGLCFASPYFAMSFIGIEFPTLVGSIIGLIVIVFTTKKGFLVPKKMHQRKVVKATGSLFEAVLPYGLLVIFLILGKFFLPSYKVIIFESYSHTINIFNPGLIFLIVIIAIWIFLRIPGKKIYSAFVESKKIMGIPVAVILCITAFVQLMITSGNNSSGFPAMLSAVSALIYVDYLPLLSPFIGGLGAFVAGSATVSTLLFGSIQNAAALAMSIPAALILALQVSGAAAGNMIALSNIVAAQATVGLHGKDYEIFKFNIIPCLIYLLILGILGMLFMYIF